MENNNIAGITLSDAAQQLERNRHWVRGAVDTLKIRPRKVGTALTLTQKEFERVRAVSESSRATSAAPA